MKQQLCLALLVLCGGCNSKETSVATSEPAGAAAPAAETDEAPQFTAKGHTTDSLELVRQRIQNDEAVLIDVREQTEWDAGHLRLATLIPMSTLNADKLDDEIKQRLPDNKPIYLHCARGGRVLKVAETLKQNGYDVRPLQAGYRALLDAGFDKANE